MSNTHDPLNALPEDQATGETAALFADIRTTMRIPMLTSIWRILAASPEELQHTWRLTKPLIETGYPETILQRLTQSRSIPIPHTIAKGLLKSAGISEEDVLTIRAIVDAYTRSNTLNMIALTALVVEPGGLPAETNPDQPHIQWPTLPAVLTASDVSVATWSLVNALNTFGATPEEPGLATLWRHLAHWPGFLEVVHAGFAPLQLNGEIKQSVLQLLDTMYSSGQQLAHYRSNTPQLPKATRDMIARYVQHPGLVARMVVIGHGLTAWINA